MYLRVRKFFAVKLRRVKGDNERFSLDRFKLILVLPLFLYLLCYYPFTFNYEIERNGQYYTIAYSCFALTLFLGFEVFFRKRFNLTHQIVVLGSLSIFIFCLVYKNLDSNEHLSILVSIVFCLLIYSTFNMSFIKSTWILICAAYVYELCYGLFQLITQVSSENLISIQGTLQNTGVYSIFIVICIPIVCAVIDILLAKRGSFLKYFIIGIVCFSTLGIIVLNKSRTAILVYFAQAILICFHLFREFFQNRFRLRRIIVSGILLLCFGVISMVLINKISSKKALSTSGRALMFEAAKPHLAENPICGIGIGKFHMFYPFWQQQYFSNNTFNNKLNYFLSAGESYLVFNEYLVLFKEIGALLFLIFLIFIFKLLNLKFDRESEFVFYMKVTIVGILISALFYYSFHIGPILFLFLFACSSLFVLKYPNKIQSMTRFTNRHFSIGAANLILASISTIISFQNVRASYKWEMFRMRDDLSFFQKLEIYEKLDKYLLRNGKYLVDRAEHLLNKQEFVKEAILLLEESKRYHISYRSIEDLGIAYRFSGKSEKSLECYLFLSGFIPAKYTPRMEIVKLYLTIGDTLKAKENARIILEMPIKIPSEEVNWIRSEATKIIQEE